MIRIMTGSDLTADVSQAPAAGYKWKVLWFAVWVTVGTGGSGTREAAAALSIGYKRISGAPNVNLTSSSTLATSGDTVGAFLGPVSGSNLGTGWNASEIAYLNPETILSSQDAALAQFTLVSGDKGSYILVVEEVPA